MVFLDINKSRFKFQILNIETQITVTDIMEQETSNDVYQEAKPTLVYNASGGRVSQNATTRTED